MREIKFRAWCEEDKCMIYDLNSPRLFHGVLIDEQDMYVFMQYTGLTDSTGKDIYEGDIVKDNYDDEDNKLYCIEIRKVEYGDDFRWCTVNLKTNEPDDKFYGGIFNLDSLTVVGNIYQNPLLIS